MSQARKAAAAEAKQKSDDNGRESREREREKDRDRERDRDKERERDREREDKDEKEASELNHEEELNLCEDLFTAVMSATDVDNRPLHPVFQLLPSKKVRYYKLFKFNY